MIKLIINISFVLTVLTSNAQNYTAELREFVGKSGLSEKMITVKTGEQITDSLVIISSIERDISFSLVKDYLYYTYKSNSDVETSQSTYYLSRYEIKNGKIKLINQKWVKRSFSEAINYKIHLFEGELIIEYNSGDCKLKYQRKLNMVNVDDFELIDKNFSTLIKIK
ncbi:MAG TPA: hypothetical protein VKG26_10505 [Bacteroidia bacterium]|nr:hypothetical protein [Bacteroidia bacterium]